jgi:hypothetical protein
MSIILNLVAEAVFTAAYGIHPREALRILFVRLFDKNDKQETRPRTTMKDLSLFFPSSRWITLTILSTALLSGCGRSKQDQAIDQAKKQAAATGQAQQVTFTDKDGNTVTTVVQPPQPGQSGQQMTTTVTPAATNAAPAVQAANQPAPPAPMVNGQPNTAPAAAPNQIAVAPANVQIPAGTDLSIRINQHISVKTSRVGDRFSGELTEPVVDGNDRRSLLKELP